MKKKKYSKKIILLSVVAFLLLCVVSVVLVLMLNSNKVKTLDFSTMKKDEILAWVETNKLKEDKVIIKYEHSDTVAKDSLISQSILPNKEIKNILILKISLGVDSEKEYDLPANYLSMTKEEIEKWLKERNFNNVSYEFAVSEKIEKDKILSIHPSIKLKINQKIVVTISSGKDENKEITVPDFSVYNSLANIESWIKTNKLKLNLKKEFSNSKEEGKVISQSPAKTSKVKAGDTITITISEGKGITVPDFVGKKASDVKNANLNFSYEYTFDIKANGTVIAQSVAKNTIVKNNTNIKLTVSKGKDDITPSNFANNFKNKPAQELKNAVESAFKSVNLKNYTIKVTEEYSDTVVKGNVIKYDNEIKQSREFRYVVSLGKFQQENNASQFNDKTVEEIKKVIDEANKKNAKIEVKTTVGDVNNEKENKTYNCTYENNILNCSLYKKEVIKTSKDSVINALTQEFVDACGNGCDLKVKDVNGKVDVNIKVVIETIESSEERERIVIERVVDKDFLLENDTVTVKVSKGIKKETYDVNGVKILINGSENVEATAELSQRIEAFNKSKQKVEEMYGDKFKLDIRKSINNSIPAGQFDESQANSASGKYNVGSDIIIYISIGETDE